MNHLAIFTICAAAFAAAFVLSDAAPTQKGTLVKFYPVSRAQYDAILDLTEGKPAISETRLVSSGVRSLSELRTTITNDINIGWQQLLNATGVQVYYEKPSDMRVDGSPLCVIKTVNLEEADDDDSGHRSRQANKDETSTTKADASRAAGGSLEGAEEDNKRPVINCIVVMKPKRPESSAPKDSHVQNHKRRRGQSTKTKNNPVYADFVDNPKLSLEEEDKKWTAALSDHRVSTRDNSDEYYGHFRRPFGGYPYYPYFNPYGHRRRYGHRRGSSEEYGSY